MLLHNLNTYNSIYSLIRRDSKLSMTILDEIIKFNVSISQIYSNLGYYAISVCNAFYARLRLAYDIFHYECPLCDKRQRLCDSGKV